MLEVSGLTDADLLRRIGEGDVHAVGELYDRYATMLFPFALRMMRDRADAEDVVHDAFVAVNDRAAQYISERGSVSAWLVTLVRNLCIDRMRRRDRRGALAREILAHEPAKIVADPEWLTTWALERDAVRRALDLLPEPQRMTLEVAFYEGLSYPEIAARENVPLGTVKSRAARALSALRQALAEVGADVGIDDPSADDPGKEP